MSMRAITVEGLGKRYRIGRAPASAEGKMRFVQKLASPFNYLINTLRNPEEDEIIWALRDVSFDVDYGEIIGIIGRNGAGKSTLLKILSRITDPTVGRAVVNGRVGSLLEVGTGFHPELTGRENIYLNGAILGMKRTEISQKFDEIVAFAEVEKFLDTPVKRYSSGMYVRLAFAVAAHLEPEILLVDEVLAVGDASFQKKCLGKMSDVAKQGRTVLFVSHNMVAVQNLCERLVWLNDGGVKAKGPTNEVLSQYLSLSYSSLREQTWQDVSTAPGNNKVRLHRVRVRPEDGSPDAPITMETPLLVEVEYWNLLPNTQLHVTLHFYTEQHIVAFSSASIETDDRVRGKELPKGLYRSVCHVPASLLNSGIHKVLLLIVQNTDKIIYRHEDALAFEVLEMEKRYGSWFGKEPGTVHPKLLWTTETQIETTGVSNKN